MLIQHDVSKAATDLLICVYQKVLTLQQPQPPQLHRLYQAFQDELALEQACDLWTDVPMITMDQLEKMLHVTQMSFQHLGVLHVRSEVSVW